ncbi:MULTISPECIES: WhiB family transcriptional regulator [Amycolatopsis]|uniref:WhiB family transcriptional regulator n=1 Tax=Amycolatopsis TaxID=1813 RepID=UPI003570A77F
MENQSSKDHGLTPAQRSIRARIAAHTSWSRTEDRAERTAPARRAALARFERLVDPDGVLDEVTRRQRADAAKRAHFQRLALLSSRARPQGNQQLTRPMANNEAQWHHKAACRSRPDLDWHSTDPDQLASCRVICTSCEVREPCLALALANHDPWGLWGGLSPGEREKLARPEAVRILPSHGTNPRYSKHRCRCTSFRIVHSAYERNRRRQSRLRRKK